MIRAIITRKIATGKEPIVDELLKELRIAATRQPYYVSGETLRAVDDPSVRVVLSTWTNVDAWNIWAESQDRIMLEQMIDSMLVGHPQISLCCIDRPTA